MPRYYSYINTNKMKSRITIDVDFENGNTPVLLMTARHSEDVRDSLVRSFYQAFGGESCWAKIEFDYPHGKKHNDPDFLCDVKITPIRPAGLKGELELMREGAVKHASYNQTV
jgi:hypothetical protein